MQKLPNRFVSELDIPLPRSCRIKNEFGCVTSVVFETDGDVHLFARGWVYCVRNNALRKGDLLMFNYEGNGLFTMRRYWAGTRFPPFDLAEALDYYPPPEEMEEEPNLPDEMEEETNSPEEMEEEPNLPEEKEESNPRSDSISTKFGHLSL